jgi:hypothetical protein
LFAFCKISGSRRLTGFTSVRKFIPDLSISPIAVFEICEPENCGGTANAVLGV